MQSLNTNVLRVPNYVSQFKCQQCGECCYQKWRIEIDEKTHKKVKDKYHAMEQDREFQELMGRNEQGKVLMKFTQGKCNALTADNLCSFQQKFGQDYLSNTCRVYPRHIHVTTRGIEFSLTFSCVAAADTLRTKEKMVINTMDSTSPSFSYMSPNRALYYLPEKLTSIKRYYHVIEDGLINIMQDRNYSIGDRLSIIGQSLAKINQIAPEEDDRALKAILSDYHSCPPISANYKMHLQLLRQMIHMRLIQDGAMAAKNIVGTLCRMIAMAESGLDLKTVASFAKIPPESTPISEITYQAKLQKYVYPVAKDIEHVFENYFVNYILKKEFYFNDLGIAYFKMAFLYALLTFFTVGFCSLTKELANEDIAVRSVIEVENGFSHSDVYFQKIKESLEKHTPADVFKLAGSLAKV